MKISIITPSFNSGDTIEASIQSVLDQQYDDFEHIIKDGGSTDGTIEVLKKYPHITWISEPDRGQVDAMTQGFAMATGDIISYLNADDLYVEGAFKAVVDAFEDDIDAVIGQVLVRTETPNGINEWLNDPAVDFPTVLRHWGPNAFCVNPVGYFYRREVQEKTPYREETGSKHDLEFVMEMALNCRIKKVDQVLGIFNHVFDTQTAVRQIKPDYWQPENFPFVDRLAVNLPEDELRYFRLERDLGYQLRRRRSTEDAFQRGMAEELFTDGEVFRLPQDENECSGSTCGFVEHDRLGCRRDWVVPVMTMGKVASKSICHTLKRIPKTVFPVEVYHVHQISRDTIERNLPKALPMQCHHAIGLALNSLFANRDLELVYKFITGVRDPVAAALSGVFENWPDTTEELVRERLQIVLDYELTYFTEQYEKALGINVFEYEFDHDAHYTIVEKDNLSILTYRLEDLSKVFPNAMHDFLGIKNLELAKVNTAKKKAYYDNYKAAVATTRFDREFLEEVYNSPLVRFFYNEDEREQFVEKWCEA